MKEKKLFLENSCKFLVSIVIATCICVSGWGREKISATVARCFPVLSLYNSFSKEGSLAVVQLSILK